jgi:Flp pilus assembly protein TadD
MSRIEVHNELGDICSEAGLDEEAQRQYKNAIDLAVREGKTEITPTYE